MHAPARTRRRFRAHTSGLFTAVMTLGLALTAPADGGEVWLVSGDRLTGEIVEVGDNVVLIHETLGRIEIPFESIASMTTRDGGSPQPAPPAALSPPPAPPAPAVPDDPPVPDAEPLDLSWKSSFIFGAGGAWGNTDNQNLFAALTSERVRPDDDRTRLDASYYWSSSDGDRDENRFTAGLLQDWYIPDSKWFYFGDARFDYDEFQSWEYRVTAHLGLGYKLIEEESFTFALRGGLGVLKEWKSPDQDLSAEGLLGADFTWQITERQSLVAGSTYYPNFSDLGEFRVVTLVDWNMLLDEELNMSLNFGFRHEHQSLVAAGDKRDDYRLIAGLRFDW